VLLKAIALLMKELEEFNLELLTMLLQEQQVTKTLQQFQQMLLEELHTQLLLLHLGQALFTVKVMLYLSTTITMVISLMLEKQYLLKLLQKQLLRVEVSQFLQQQL
jgi:hypothetical protein